MSAYNFKDETGNIYEYLTVLSRAENTREGRAQWLCQCKCGKTCIILGKHLRSGNTKSCGCLQKERAIQSNINRVDSIIGKQFGKLTVIKENGFIFKNSGKRVRTYLCHCECGNDAIVEHQYLTYGDTTSCGCLRSKGEYQIEAILKQFDVPYQKEYIFSDLFDILPLRFDFAIFKNNQLFCLIEYQGEQHYNPSNGYYNETMIRHDKMKKEYCVKNNIRLIIINYKRNYNISLLDLNLEDYND